MGFYEILWWAKLIRDICLWHHRCINSRVCTELRFVLWIVFWCTYFLFFAQCCKVNDRFTYSVFMIEVCFKIMKQHMSNPLSNRTRLYCASNVQMHAHIGTLSCSSLQLNLKVFPLCHKHHTDSDYFSMSLKSCMTI